jgi:hypothetical protein
MKKVLLIVVALTFVLTAAAFAGGNATHKVAIHVNAYPITCKGMPVFTACTQIVTTYPLGGNIEVIPVFYDLAGFKLNELGMSWPEATWGSASWTKCKGDVAVGMITNSAVPEVPSQTIAQTNGTAIAWSTCQSASAFSAPGFAWLFAADPGLICPVPNPVTRMMGVTDCSANALYDAPQCVSCAGVLGHVGDDPCRPTAVESSTWGEIKSIFK